MFWRGVEFPTTEFEVSLSQDHAIHKWPDRDGAHVEATGRAPLLFTARIPFYTTISPGINEGWSNLYPETYRAFLAACSDRTTGDLQHPELGIIKCKVQSVRTKWDAHRRAGVDVDVTWIESTDTEKELNDLLTSQSKTASAQSEALSLDTNVVLALPDNAEFKPTFADSIRSIQATLGSIEYLASTKDRLMGQLNYRIGALEDTVDRTSAALGNSGALNWPLINDIEHLKSTLFEFGKQLDLRSKPKGFYTVPKDSTFAGVAQSILQSTGTNVQVGDLLVLNPKLGSSPVVKAGTVIQYYT